MALATNLSLHVPRAPARVVRPIARRDQRREHRAVAVPAYVTMLRREVEELRQEISNLRRVASTVLPTSANPVGSEDSQQSAESSAARSEELFKKMVLDGINGGILAPLGKTDVATLNNEAPNFKTPKIDHLTRRTEEHQKKAPFVFSDQPTQPRPAPLLSAKVYTRLYKPFTCPAVNDGRVDKDLLYHLRLYSAFQPRTLTLANSLKMRAIRWMGDYNCRGLGSDDIYHIVVNTVIEAFTIDEHEMRIKARVAQDTMFKENNAYFRSGPLVQD